MHKLCCSCDNWFYLNMNQNRNAHHIPTNWQNWRYVSVCELWYTVEKELLSDIGLWDNCDRRKIFGILISVSKLIKSCLQIWQYITRERLVNICFLWEPLLDFDECCKLKLNLLFRHSEIFAQKIRQIESNVHAMRKFTNISPIHT